MFSSCSSQLGRHNKNHVIASVKWICVRRFNSIKIKITQLNLTSAGGEMLATRVWQLHITLFPCHIHLQGSLFCCHVNKYSKSNLQPFSTVKLMC